MATASQRGRRNRHAGRKREYHVADYLSEQGWVTAFRHRHQGEQGFDVMALKAGVGMLVEVKSTKRPFDTFGPRERQQLLERAAQAGAEPVLAHWPYDGRGVQSLRFYGPDEWPGRRKQLIPDLDDLADFYSSERP